MSAVVLLQYTLTCKITAVALCLSKHVQCECITQCMEIYRGISTALGAFISQEGQLRQSSYLLNIMPDDLATC